MHEWVRLTRALNSVYWRFSDTIGTCAWEADTTDTGPSLFDAGLLSIGVVVVTPLTIVLEVSCGPTM
ncbi:hypothetical protein J6590_024891 [Homalodisca vitripennis]|nr:hypothetical protein J6590_024891 [Homalodisca vitripennis]